MTVLFFKVEDVLNDPDSEARAPDGSLGVVDRYVKKLRETLKELGPGAQLVLYGDWAKEWNFDDEKCTPKGKYLNKKLERQGLHIMEKSEGADPVLDYLERKHPEHHMVLA